MSLLHHPCWLQLVLALSGHHFSFNFLNFLVWLRITDEGSIPEMRIWSSILQNKLHLIWMVNFTLPSTTSEMISIPTLQTSRSWVVIFHLRRPMACLSLNLYDTHGTCSSYECFILRARRLSSNLLKQGYLVERLKSSFRKFYGRYGDLIQLRLG